VNKSFVFLIITTLGAWQPVSAVQNSVNGMGEVLIYPYFSVNNDLNTLYSVVNTTGEAKAIKVSFYEGDIGLDVLTFHVYLSPHDVWTGALVPDMSGIPGHIGESSVLHLTVDESCAPYLTKLSGQQFLPYVIDVDADADNRSMQRATEGHLVVIEMGVLTGEAYTYVDHGNVGLPANCGALEAAWNTGEWTLDALEEPTGGLLGGVSLINVNEGLSLSYDAIALTDFWEGNGLFNAPGDLEPNLGSGTTASKVLLSDGTVAEAQWSSGAEAVSAVLMKSELYNEYAYDAIVNGKSEWLVNFPTKALHTTDTGVAIGPFTQVWDGAQSCDEFTTVFYDRETEPSYQFDCCVDPPPPPPDDPQFCYSSNVFELLPPYTEPNPVSAILGSDNLAPPATYFDSRETENGWGVVRFSGSQNMTPLSGPGLRGLPATGFMVQQFTNAGAADGLLAQYGNLFRHKGRVETVEAGQ